MGLKKQTEIHILIWEFENLVGGFDFQFQNFLNLVRGGGGAEFFNLNYQAKLGIFPNIPFLLVTPPLKPLKLEKLDLL